MSPPAPAPWARAAEAAWRARRRRARLALLYALMTALLVVMVGPLLYAFVSSFRDDALTWPPELYPPKFWPRNWVGAWTLGVQGSGDGWFGGLAPGRALELEVTFRLPPEPAPRRASGPAAVRALVLPPAAGMTTDPRPDVRPSVQLVAERPLPDGGVERTYRVRLEHVGRVFHERVRLAVTAPAGAKLVRATLWPSIVSERFTRTVLTWQDAAPGVLGYVFEAYIRAWTAYRGEGGKPLFARWVLNSLGIALGKVALTLALASLAGYALARLRFPGRNFLFLFTIFTMMVPGQVTMISNFLLLRDGIFGLSRLFGAETLINTYAGVFLPGLVATSAVFLMKQFLESIPRELEEAARIDGASTLQIYARIVLPLSRPALGALAILTFQGSWNELFWPLVVLRSQEKFTLPIGLMQLMQFYGAQAGVNWNLILASVVIAALPVLVIFVLFQRYFIEGIKLTGLKG